VLSPERVKVPFYKMAVGGVHSEFIIDTGANEGSISSALFNSIDKKHYKSTTEPKEETYRISGGQLIKKKVFEAKGVKVRFPSGAKSELDLIVGFREDGAEPLFSVTDMRKVGTKLVFRPDKDKIEFGVMKGRVVGSGKLLLFCFLFHRQF
jgi:hypothetical protein